MHRPTKPINVCVKKNSTRSLHFWKRVQAMCKHICQTRNSLEFVPKMIKLHKIDVIPIVFVMLLASYNKFMEYGKKF